MTRQEALEIYKLEVQKFEGTRNSQWKFNFSLWTLLILVIYYVDKLDILNTYYFVFGLFVFTIHYFFVTQVQYSLESSKILRSTIVNNLNDPQKQNFIVDIKLKPKLSNLLSETFFARWIIYQCSITLFLILLLWARVYYFV
jgi:hypothetical protein